MPSGFFAKLFENVEKLTVDSLFVRRGDVLLIFARFPHNKEPGLKWHNKDFLAYPFTYFLTFTIAVDIAGHTFAVYACPKFAGQFVGVEEAHIILNTQPPVELPLHVEAVEALEEWALNVLQLPRWRVEAMQHPACADAKERRFTINVERGVEEWL